MTVYRLADDPRLFPDPADADAGGLLAVGGDLSPERLLTAYSLGIFPWYDEASPILWWAPDPRCILLPEEFHVPRSLRRVLNSNRFQFDLNADFPAVVNACAERRVGGTWLVPEMREAYIRLHELGFAHSVEARLNGDLVGGLYGVALGGAFFGESMFHTAPDASKAALVYLVSRLTTAGFSLIDCQQTTPNLLRFGARPVPGAEFRERLAAALRRRPSGGIFGG